MKKIKTKAQSTTKKTKVQPLVDLSWKRYLLPDIHPEGVKILTAIIVPFIIIGCFWNWIWCLGAPLSVFAFYFFRNPERVTPQGDDLVISPADGIVSNIVDMVPPEDLDIGREPVTRVSIFMSVFNVHVNRCPVTGTVHALKYHKAGKFVSAADKDSDENERQDICVRMADGTRIGFVQIAGLIARRIYCPLKISQKLKAGEIFGIIRFGSRLDVYLPKGVKPCVLIGQSMVAGETIIAKLPVSDKKTK